MAAALAAAKLNIQVAHVEAGLRSYDMTMPEEINRRITDHISTLLFADEPRGELNLRNEQVLGKIFQVGNVMIDTLIYHQNDIDKSTILHDLDAEDPRGYAVLTLHRPSNVDSKGSIEKIMNCVHEVESEMPVFFPCHPRTKKAFEEFKIEVPAGMFLMDPLPYFDFMKLIKNAKMVLTDSGGIQEETSFLHVPCLTLRETTERPITLTNGTNCLVGSDPRKVRVCVRDILRSEHQHRVSLPLNWDGHAAERIVEHLAEWWSGYNITGK